MRVLIAGGGTGGHLFPGIAVAEELVERGHEVRFVGTSRGIEARVCPKEGWPLEFIDVKGLKGGGVAGALRGLVRVPSALVQSRRILRAWRPDVVLGVGGYASGPVVLAAAAARIPTAVLEQNSVPGITNRILGQVVRAVFGTFDHAARYFPAKKYRVVGNPVRRRIREALARTSPQDAPAGVLVVGGSQGAHAVNLMISDAAILLASRGRALTLIHQTGQADLQAMTDKYREAGVEAEVSAFIEDMATAYRRAAVAVTRAGASTLSELALVGVPAVLIPLPHAADDHQRENARAFEAAGAARRVEQGSTTPEQLAAVLEEILSDPGLRAGMAQAALSLGRPDAHADVANALESLA